MEAAKIYPLIPDLPYPEFPKINPLHTAYEKSRLWAIGVHQSTNHLYDDYLPYEFHLRMVESNYHKFEYLVSEQWKKFVWASCWLHDVIEDCRITYSTLKENFGEDVADIVYACTNEKGKNRKERESDKYFEGIRTTPYATFVKLCDRLANIQYSKMTESESNNKLNMYRKEHTRFKEQLYDEKYKPMFDLMEELLKESK